MFNFAMLVSTIIMIVAWLFIEIQTLCDIVENIQSTITKSLTPSVSNYFVLKSNYMVSKLV